MFFRQLKYDCEFLEAEGIMDYSLFLGVHIDAPSRQGGFSPPLEPLTFKIIDGLIIESDLDLSLTQVFKVSLSITKWIKHG